MFKMIGIIAPLLGLALLAGGCCCVGPAYQPCGVPCEPGCDVGCDSCDTGGGDCDVSCGQTYGACATGCAPHCCLLNPLHWVGGLFHSACRCDSGCGEIYWGGWWGDPPGCDPCDPCGNWVGGCGCGGCNSGCDSCGSDCGGGQSAPSGQCADCMKTAGIPQNATIINQGDNRTLTPSNAAPRRAPTKAAPTTVKKSPQAMRTYNVKKQR